MKNKNSINIFRIKAISLCFLASSSLAMAANYDLQSHHPSVFDNSDKSAHVPGDSKNSSSILNSLQNSQISNGRALFQEIMGLVQQNKLDEAEKKLAPLLKESNAGPEVFNLEGIVKAQKKDNVAAQQNFEKALQLAPGNIFANLGLAKIYFDAGQLDKAKDAANKVLAVDNKNVAAYLVLADVANKQKDNNETEKYLLQALNNAKNNQAAEFDIFKKLGLFYVTLKTPEKILPLADELVKRYSGNSEALSLLAQAQVANNDKAAAEKTLTKAVTQDKQDVFDRLFLAKILMEQPDKQQDVMKLLDEATKIVPDNPEPLTIKAAYFLKQQNYAGALELADKIDKQFPKIILGKLLKADIYISQKKLDNALDIYKQIYKIQPDNRILFTLSELMVSQKQIPEAIALLEKELPKNDKNPDYRFKLASLYQLQQDDKQAENQYKAILAIAPDNPIVLNNLAFIYSKNNDPQAIELAKKAYDKAPNEAAIADTYGYILVKQGDAKAGLGILEKAAAAAPKMNEIQYHLAVAYATNNDKKKAIDILEPLVKSEQDFSEKKAAVSLLSELKGQ